MSRYTQIDLSQLPPPAVIQVLSYDTIKAAIVSDLIARDPAFTALLESDPAIKLLEAFAYRELLLRGQINDAARACMLAMATGSDLDNLAALMGVQRAVSAAGTETDDRLRMRTQLALEALSCAGPVGAYLFYAFTTSMRVTDASAYSPAPGAVMVTIYASDGGDQDLLNSVSAALNADSIRPLTDVISVQAATLVHYNVVAQLRLYPGPDSSVVINAAQAAVLSYTNAVRRLGFAVTLSDLYGALTQAGVQGSIITSPTQDMVQDQAHIPICDSITITAAPTRVD